MGLLEKALLIKEIDQTFQTIEQGTITFHDRVKAEIHLKEIRENDQYAKEIHSAQDTQVTSETLAQYFVKTTPYQLSYRGLFNREDPLKQALQKTPEMGWAILLNAEQQWQAWLIMQANKPPIHSNWKSNIEESYTWVLQQQKLFKCLTLDEVTESRETENQLLHPIQHTDEPIIPTLKLAPTILNLTLEQYQCKAHPIDYIPAFVDQLFHLEFLNTEDSLDFAEFVYLKTSNQSIIHSPIYIAEQVDGQGKFIKYMVLFGTSNIEQTINLMDALSEHNQLWLSSIRSCNWLIFKDKFTTIEKLFGCFVHYTQFIWQQNKGSFCYIPISLIKSHKMITFQEEAPTQRTPLILLNDNHRYRLIHGERRIKLLRREIAYPFIQFDRDQLTSWQAIQTIIHELATPVSTQDLTTALEKYISKSN